MLRRLAAHFRNQWTGTLALFLVLTGGTAMAVDGSLPGQNTVGSADIINGEVATNDLGENSVGSTKIIDGQVKNQDLGAGASNTNTIADGGVWGVDVKDGSLTGADIDESSLDGLAFGDADTLDGKDSSEFAPAEAYVKGSGKGRRTGAGGSARSEHFPRPAACGLPAPLVLLPQPHLEHRFPLGLQRLGQRSERFRRQRRIQSELPPAGRRSEFLHPRQPGRRGFLDPGSGCPRHRDDSGGDRPSRGRLPLSGAGATDRVGPPAA